MEREKKKKKNANLRLFSFFFLNNNFLDVDEVRAKLIGMR